MTTGMKAEVEVVMECWRRLRECGGRTQEEPFRRTTSPSLPALLPLGSPTPYFILSSVWMAVRLRRVVPARSPWLVDLRCAALHLASGIEPPLLASRK